jgi:sporulation protein YlmC with PRC-barrel domain
MTAGGDAELGVRDTEPVLHFAPWNTLRLLTVTEDDLREHQEESEAELQAAEEHHSTVGSNLGSPDLVRLGDFGGEIDEHWQEAKGRTVLDKSGGEVGTVEELYVWKEPSTVHLIKVSGEEGSFLIPVHAVTSVVDDGVKLETARSKVTESPEYGSDEGSDDETRRAAFAHFGYPDPLDLGG